MKNTMMKFLGLALFIGMTSGVMSGCNGSVQVVGPGPAPAPVDPYYHAWYDVYGHYCNNGYPESGCNFYSDGTKIAASGDPYHTNMTLTTTTGHTPILTELVVATPVTLG
jgi:hypothetical protein